MADTNGSSDWKSRLDEMERILKALMDDHVRLLGAHHRHVEESHRWQEEFQRDLKGLLTAQVLLGDKLNQLAEAGKHTDERLNALISVVDGLIRKQPPQPS